MLSKFFVSISHNNRSFNRAIAFLIFVVFCFFSISSSWAVTVQTYGPFDVTFFNNGETYTDYWGSSYTGTKNWTTAEMDDVAATIQIWDGGITNSPARQVKLNLMWNPLGGSLGISLNDYSGDGTTALSSVEQLWRQGTNFPTAYADNFIIFDTNTTWHTGSGIPTGSAFDFRSVIAHEIGHSLGFASMYDWGSNTWWSGGVTEWDKHLRDAATGGNQPNVGGSGTPSPFNVTANPIYFDGTNANAANNGNRAAINAPNPYQDGSSLSHLNEATFPNALMSPSITNAQMVRQPTALEWQMLKDLGWTLDTVNKTWTNSTNTLQWGTAESWNIAGVPDATQTARFTNFGLASGNTITLGGNRTVGGILIDTTTNFTIGGSSGTLTIATGSLTRTDPSSGTQILARPISLGANAMWDIAGSGNLSVSGGISGNCSLEKRGTSTLGLSGTNTYNGTTLVRNGLLNISGGSTTSSAFDILSGATLSFSGSGLNFTAAASFSNSGLLTVGAGSNLTISGNLSGTGNTLVNGLMTANSIDQDTLTIGGGAIVTINAIAGGPICSRTIRAVPEPGTFIILLVAAAAVGWLRKSARCIGH